MNQLKDVRETSFLSFEEISEQIRIPVYCLRAIEEKDYAKLPKKKDIIEKYILSYAEFLEVDPEPILHAYHNSSLTDEFPTRSRRKNKQSIRKSFFYTYRFYLLGVVVCLALAITTWLIPKEKPEVKSIAKKDVLQAPISNQNRPNFALQQTSSDFPNSETWFISRIDKLHVNIQTSGTVNIRIRENGPKGKILMEKSIHAGEPIDISEKKWLLIRIDKPNLTKIKVNDVLIDTSTQKSSYIYELKIQDSIR